MNFPATLERARAMIANVAQATELSAATVGQSKAVGYIQALVNEGLADAATGLALLQELQTTWDSAVERLDDGDMPAVPELDFAAFIVEHKYVGTERVDLASTPEGPYHLIGRLPLASFLETMDLTEDEYNRGERHAREMRRIYGPIPASRELALRVAMSPGQPPVVEVLGWVSGAAYAHDAPAAVVLH